MFVRKLALSRRTFLRGLGVTLGLPMLDAMVPALSAATGKPTPRLGCLYIPNGIIHGPWIPSAVGSGFELSPSLSPLAGVRDQLLVLTGLAHLEADSKGDGNGDHPRASAVWLSGVHAWTNGPAKLGTTLDQVAADTLGQDTPVRSLELALEKATQIGCDTTDCFFSNTIAWRSPTTPLPMEPHPRVVFERLFGDGGTAAQRRAQMRTSASILDSITREVESLTNTLGSSDRAKLDEYVGAVRDVERRIQVAEQKTVDSAQALPERPIDIPESYEEHARLMFDLQVLAFQADITRVTTTLMGREQSARAFPQIGISEQHHSLSHHMNNPELMARKAVIDKHLVSLLAYFLEKLETTPDGDGSLLDHTFVLYGGGLGDPNNHDHTNLPCLLAGGRAFAKSGRHVRYPERTPMANLFLNVLDKLGVPVPEKIGDSTEHLADI